VRFICAELLHTDFVEFFTESDLVSAGLQKINRRNRGIGQVGSCAARCIGKRIRNQAP